ncbi:MAG: Ig-like domain-containing protein [Odoribacter sp.]|nr:Ig-like domain-containing protein [Odoribacter sp.]
MKSGRLHIGWGVYAWAVFIGYLVCSCANKGYPEGGPKDVTPPHVVVERPASFSCNFDKKSINIYFDEFVQLKNVNEKFIISPPQVRKPKVSLRGKYVMVEFQDSLRPETTYSMDFADAIADNNEGNPLGYYRYVFSTGNLIDTLELSGNVVDAETNEPVYNAYVFIYRNQADSVPITELPDYMARTDSSGFFRLTNLRQDDYKVVAVMDENRDYKYVPETEQIGFLDSVVRPVMMEMTRTDTLSGDSVMTTSYLAYGPNNLFLRLFPEEPTQLYMTNSERTQRELLYFTFSIPGRNDFEIELLDTVVSMPWYLAEQSVGKDTVKLWLTDSSVYKKDTLRFRLSYLKTDSLHQKSPHTDTVRLVFTEKQKTTRKKQKQEEEASAKPVITFLNVKASGGSEQDLNRGILLEFEKPLTGVGLDSIKLFEKVDTVYQPVAFELKQDSVCLRCYGLKVDWKPEKEYKLVIDSARITDIYGHHNNRLEKKFKVRGVESYGKIILHAKGGEGQVLLQLYKWENKKADNGRQVFTIVDEKVVEGAGDVVFDFVNAGKYGIRAVFDENRNGRWDTGLYLKRQQPEKIVYLPGEINVRKNFDIDQEFNLKVPYTRKDKKMERE